MKTLQCPQKKILMVRFQPQFNHTVTGLKANLSMLRTVRDS